MANTRHLYVALANIVQARENCHQSENVEWFDRWTEKAEILTREHLPSGSGFDAGTKLDLDRSSGELLVFTTSYHHMDKHGGYDGWTEHTVRVRGSLMHGFTVAVSGSNRNGIKDYIYECFDSALATVGEF